MQLAATGFESSWIRSTILRVVAVKILVLTLVFDPSGLQAFDFPKSLLSRSTEWILLGLLLLAVLRWGIAIWPRTPLHLVVATYVFALVVSAAFAENTYIAVFGEQGSYQGLTLLADMVVLYLALAASYRRPADLREPLLAAVAAAVATSAYAVWQFAGLDPLRWTRDPSIRPFGTFGNPNQLAHYLSVAAGICLGLAIVGRSFRASLVAGLAAVAFIAVSALTGARAAVLAIAVAGVLVWVLARMADRPGRSSPFRIAGVAAAAVVAVLVVLSPTGQRLLEGPLADRVALYEVATDAFLARPIVGYGPDHFGIAFTIHRVTHPFGPFPDEERTLWAHSVVLQAAATTGSFGVLALVLLFVSGSMALWRAVRLERRVAVPILIAWAAYWTHALVTVPSISVDWFPWASLAIAAALTGSRVAQTIRPLRALTRVTVIAAAIVAALTVLPALRANHDAGLARALLLVGAAGPAELAARSAVTLDPDRADYWNWLGITSEAQGRWDDAASHYAQAARRSSHTAIYWANIARANAGLWVARGDPVRAKSEAREPAMKALAIDALDPSVRRSLADTSFLLGDCDGALRGIVEAYRFSRGNTRYTDQLDRAAACSDDWISGLEQLRAGLAVRETAPLVASIAIIELRSGDLSGARVDAHRALELAPDNAAALKVLASLPAAP